MIREWLHKDCNSLIETLRSDIKKYNYQLTGFLSQITELRGILDYTLDEKNREIEELKSKLKKETKNARNK